MTTEEKNIRLIIRKTLSEIENVSESDILVRAGVNWDEVKPKFLETINDLVAKIDDDKYDEVERLIMEVMGMLKIWRAKIRKGKEMVDRIHNVETLDEDNEINTRSLEDKKNRQQKNKIIRRILHTQGGSIRDLKGGEKFDTRIDPKIYTLEELNNLSFDELNTIWNQIKDSLN